MEKGKLIVYIISQLRRKITMFYVRIFMGSCSNTSIICLLFEQSKLLGTSLHLWGFIVSRTKILVYNHHHKNLTSRLRSWQPWSLTSPPKITP